MQTLSFITHDDFSRLWQFLFPTIFALPKKFRYPGFNFNIRHMSYIPLHTCFFLDTELFKYAIILYVALGIFFYQWLYLLALFVSLKLLVYPSAEGSNVCKVQLVEHLFLSQAYFPLNHFLKSIFLCRNKKYPFMICSLFSLFCLFLPFFFISAME